MVAEALVPINVERSKAAPTKVARIRMTLYSPDPGFAAPPINQLTMSDGSPKIDFERLCRRRGGNCKILEQFENVVLPGESPARFIGSQSPPQRQVCVAHFHCAVAPDCRTTATQIGASLPTKAANSWADPGHNRTFSWPGSDHSTLAPASLTSSPQRISC
jgi:hypothetical protein